MSFDRRKFLKSAGSLAALGFLPAEKYFSSATSQIADADHRPRIAILYDVSFPLSGEITVSIDTLKQNLSEFELRFLTVAELGTELSTQTFDLFINPYGSLFPQDRFDIILSYLGGGGHWLNIGGVPLSRPVVREGDAWRIESQQVAYHQKIGITQSFPVGADAARKYVLEKEDGEPETEIHEIRPNEIYELYCRFSESKDTPSEDGSAGPRDAVLRSLVVGIDRDEMKFAAPIVVVDRVMGTYSGGRWVFANFSGTMDPSMIRSLAEYSLQSVVQFTVKPAFPSYNDSETPTYVLRAKIPDSAAAEWRIVEATLLVADEAGNTIYRKAVAANQFSTSGESYINLPGKPGGLRPALYRINASLSYQNKNSKKIYKTVHNNGFWVWNKDLFHTKDRIEAGRDYFLLRGENYPITGTTYMASDVHRKFLLEPNPYIWDHDFAKMKQAGINMVRTGIWTGWKNVMLDSGAPSESVLRAMDAFVLTAVKYRIPVIMTLFAFLPETWGGENAYLDPRSLDAQKEFVSAIAQRYRNVKLLLWDVINEPSFCNPQRLWECRPNFDRFEVKAWKEWLAQKYPVKGSPEGQQKIEEIFRTTPDDATALPQLTDFDDVNVLEERRPIKAFEYHLFAQAKFAEWVRMMKDTLRANGSPEQLITIGQDEGGTGESPNNHFFADQVDFTCIHNWWLNDDLVWDNVLTKTEGKPNLIEETGIMSYEKRDGSPWRTEEDARNLLERKLAISCGVGGAGFIEWVWNANPYMKSDNEAAIGLHRIDGTVKPEYAAVKKFARFFHENAQRMVDRVVEDVCMVIPHSQFFYPGTLAGESTKKCVRAICYCCNIPIRSVSEYRVDKLHTIPRLFFYPSPQTINRAGWLTLLEYVRSGSILVVTGPLDLDDHFSHIDRTTMLGWKSDLLPVAEEEYLSFGGNEMRFSFRGEKMQRLLKARPVGSTSIELKIIQHGTGRILWSPIPLEMSDSREPLEEFYRYVFSVLDIHPSVSVVKPNPSILMLATDYRDSIMCTFVSESEKDSIITIELRGSRKHLEIAVPGQRSNIIFINRRTGDLQTTLD